MKQFILKVNSSKILKVVSCSVSLMLTLIWSIDILFEKLRSEKGDEFENTLCTILLGGGNFMQSLSSFNIFSGDMPFDALIIGPY